MSVDVAGQLALFDPGPPPSRAKHRQVEVPAPPWYPLGSTVEVDAGLAGLLWDLWAEGFVTFASCEDWGEGTAQVMFWSPTRQRVRRVRRMVASAEEQARAFARRMTSVDDPPGWRFMASKDGERMAVYFPSDVLEEDS
jgi:hypothetical protein